MSNRQVRAFAGPNAEQKAERAGHWLKTMARVDASREFCVKNEIRLQKATNEDGSNQAGGFLAPHDFDAAILAVRDLVGAARNADVRPARSMNQLRPRRVGGVTVNIVPEGQPIPESSFELDAIAASLRGFKILVRSSTELYEDSKAADLAEFVATECGYALAAKEDDITFSGDGSSTYGGMTGLAVKLAGTKSAVQAASTHNTFLTLDSADLSNLMGAVLAVAIRGAQWFVSEIAFAQCLCRLAAANGGIVWMADANGVMIPHFLGFPVAMSSMLPSATTSLAGKPMLYFGNLKMSTTIVERQSATVFTTSYERALEVDQVLLRAVRREHIINHLGSGTSDTANATTNAPIACLYGTT